MKAALMALLLVFGAGYLALMAWTGEVRTRVAGVWLRRQDDPTLFWFLWVVFASAYAWLLYTGVPVVLEAAR